MEIDGYKLKFISAERSYYRGGALLKRLLSKPEKYLSGKEALSIFNTYAIPPYELKLLLMSHGFAFDENEFIRLLIDQKERSKHVIPCQKDVSDFIDKQSKNGELDGNV